MALMAMTTSDVIRYVSDKDPAKVKKLIPVDDEKPDGDKKLDITIGPNATYFTLAPLDVFLMGYIYDNASSLTGQAGGAEIGIKTRMNQTNIDAVRFGLVAMENFHDDKSGKAVQFKRVKTNFAGRKYETVPDDIMTKLGVQLCQELAEKIKELSEVSVAEAKNSVEA